MEEVNKAVMMHIDRVTVLSKLDRAVNIWRCGRRTMVMSEVNRSVNTWRCERKTVPAVEINGYE